MPEGSPRRRLTVRTRTRPAAVSNVVPFPPSAEPDEPDHSPRPSEPNPFDAFLEQALAEEEGAPAANDATPLRITAQRPTPLAERSPEQRRALVRAAQRAGVRLTEETVRRHDAGEDIFAEPEPAEPLGPADEATPQRMSEIDARETEWTWHPYVPRGMMTVLAGRGGRGKGLVLADLAARVTTGSAWPNSLDAAEPGDVLWVEGEDPAPQVLRPRFEAANADCGRILYMRPHEFRMLCDLRAFLVGHRIRLIVLSPLTASLCLRDSAKDEDVRRALEPLQDAIEAAGSALIGIMHLNKKPDLDAVERMLGSVAFGNFVRSVLLVEQEPEADHAIRRMAHGKWNVGTKGGDLLYTSRYVGDDPRGRDQRVRIDWSVPEGGDVDANRLFDRPRATGCNAERRDAGGWLIQYLAEHGRSNSSDVLAAGAAEGYSRSAIRQARQRHPGIHTERTNEVPARSIWSLAQSDRETT